MQLEQLPKRYQEQALQQLRDSATSTTAKRKCNTGNEQVAKEEATGYHRCARFLSPVRITYRDSRHRLIDADNGWTKYFTDALVTAGVLADDTPKEIPQRPSVTQAKSKEEGLIIIVEEI